jgi:GntR family transcriptional regulator, transcriptional repressor for pyruvate dehydrogenase complex
MARHHPSRPSGSCIEGNPLAPGVLPNRSNLTVAVSQEIARIVRENGLGPGDRLPTVKELAEACGVAVPTVREAIRRMEALGTLEVRHGSGIFVRSGQPRLMMVHPDLGTIDGQVILDLLQSRLLIEPYLAEQAALSPRGEATARLGELLREAEGFLGTDDAQLRRVNMAFHAGIARCSGNVVLMQVMEMLIDLYSSEQSVMLTIADQREQDHREHVAIYDAIQHGDAERAKTLMTEHITNAKDFMTAKLAMASHARKVSWLNTPRPWERAQNLGRTPGSRQRP